MLLIEDLSPNQRDEFPGADIDAVALIKPDGEVHFASVYEEDTDVDCTGNLACNPDALLGPPDVIDGGQCVGGEDRDGSGAVALGGGFVIVRFHSPGSGEEVLIEEGDVIHIYEVGQTECGRFEDEPFRLSGAISDDLIPFTLIGEGGRGSNEVLVEGVRQ